MANKIAAQIVGNAVLRGDTEKLRIYGERGGNKTASRKKAARAAELEAAKRELARKPPEQMALMNTFPYPD